MGQRLFVAIDAGSEAASAIRGAIARVRAHAARAAWTDRTVPHLTLVFLGEVPDDRVEPVRIALREAARRNPPLTLRIHGVGVFGRPAHPRTLWAGVEGDREQVVALVADLRRALVAVDLPLEDRAYQPHLTLARARGDRGDPGLARCAAELRDCAFAAIQATAITLYRSELHPAGARHHEVERCALAAPS
ncbi:MAG: RNA 2',3'-cyclic phosphodiesterase [Vicinamibacteria bacterium]|nr:RNA 2',3'-cyclic phosphodiesterase [Vicinamibacteria bacterium]